MDTATEARLLEDERARAQLEYENIKKEFTLEEEGEDAPSLDAKAESQLNAQLIEALVNAKMVSIDRLALEFNLKVDVSFN
ncbi:unnamed protein product [Protopolystoma xenopodis]|uniref:Uncharacterized protein n=1 Tax=Protopolystoma xenopodis TaxID=117903 RepID=A0A3S5AAN1_9PLAT|nr:unnamed protein product [Protopolystoma xenopodis]